MGEQQGFDGRAGANQDQPAQPVAPARRSPRPVEERHPFRAFFGRNRALNTTYRTLIAVVGAVIVIGGVALIPLPGPGWLIVFAGLAVLATEFAWAGRLLDFARDKVRGWTDWVTRQSLAVRMALGLLGLAVVSGAVWLYVATQGVPGWLPIG